MSYKIDNRAKETIIIQNLKNQIGDTLEEILDDLIDESGLSSLSDLCETFKHLEGLEPHLKAIKCYSFEIISETKNSIIENFYINGTSSFCKFYQRISLLIDKMGEYSFFQEDSEEVEKIYDGLFGIFSFYNEMQQEEEYEKITIAYQILKRKVREVIQMCASGDYSIKEVSWKVKK